MLVQVVPPLVLLCHWTVGAGLPVATAEKVAVLPRLTVLPEGWVVTDGAVTVLEIVNDFS